MRTWILVLCLLSIGMNAEANPNAKKSRKRAPNNAASAAKPVAREMGPDGFLTGDMVAPNRLSVGGGIGFLNINNVGYGIGLNAEYARRLEAGMPLYVGLEFGAMRWDTHAGPKGGSLFDEPAPEVQNTMAITAYTALATAYLRYFEKSPVHVTVGLSAGGGLISEAGATAAGSDITLVSARFHALLRIGFELELDYEFEVAQAGVLRFEPRFGLLGNKPFFAPQLSMVVPF